MPKLIFLGTSAAVPDQTHDNTHLAILTEKRLLLIDAGNNPFLRLQQAGLDPLQVTDLLVTHFHPDHASAVPAFLMNIWLSGRTAALQIYGLHTTLERIRQNLELYEWKSWPNFFPVFFHPLLEQELAPAIEADDLNLYTSPVHHMVPGVGLRIEFPSTGFTLAFSSDTEPCQEVVNLASGAQILIHEATGAGLGHSSAEQAGEIARQADVHQLYLAHYPTGNFDSGSLVAEAGRSFGGRVFLASDLMEVDLSSPLPSK